MSLMDDARTVEKSRRIENAKRVRPNHPTGWEPGLNTEKNEIIGRWDNPLQDGDYEDAFAQLLEWMGFDPKDFTIENDKVEVRVWNAHYGVDSPPEWFWYYKTTVVRRRKPEDVTDLVKLIRRRKAVAKKTIEGDRTFAVLNSDWQLGKKDGEGTAYTVRAVSNAIPAIKARYQALRKQGHEIDTLLIANLGDLVEGCAGHYPMQTFTVELSRREQVRLGRELLTAQLLAWADDFEHVVVVAVPGNHGENRNEDGKSFTNLGDNDDVALVEQVAEAFDLAVAAGSTRYEHVKFLIPDNQLSFTLDVHGTIVGLTHGHAANTRAISGKNLQHSKVWDWWYGQMMGRQPVADADLLISGHFHYLSLFTQGGRTALQAPAMDDGSGWYVDKGGLDSLAATVTLVIGGGTNDGKSPGWEALDVLDA